MKGNGEGVLELIQVQVGGLLWPRHTEPPSREGHSLHPKRHWQFSMKYGAGGHPLAAALGQLSPGHPAVAGSGARRLVLPSGAAFQGAATAAALLLHTLKRSRV